jgi:hypothetical protein
MNELQGLSKDQLIDTVQQLEEQLNSIVSVLVTHGELSRAVLHLDHIVEKAKGKPTSEQLEEICASIQHAAKRLRR